jgi:hypothetical protein
MAYESSWLLAMAKDNGFCSAKIPKDADEVPHMLVAQV